MKELSKFVSNSKMKICFVLLYLFGIVDIFYSLQIAAAEIFIATAVLVFYLIGRNKQNRIMRKYLEELSLNIETATHDSVMNSPFPMAIVRDTGEIIWYNNNFGDMVDSDGFLSPYIQDTFQGFTVPKSDFGKCEVTVGEKYFEAYGVSTKSPVTDKKDSEQELIFVYYFIDVTELHRLKEDFSDRKIVKGYIYIDNLDELTKSVTDSERTSLISQVEKNIFDFTAKYNAVLSKAERDRYSFIAEYKDFISMKADKFSLLKQVKSIESSNLPFTLSIGVGVGEDLSETENFAKTALDLALGRGGDQAVIKENSDYTYFGGNNKEVEKRTKVRSRFMALSFKEMLENCESVVIMGHKNADMDSIGAAIGLSRIAKAYDKPVKILIDEKNVNMDMVRKYLNDSKEYGDLFVSGELADEYVDSHTLLAVVDTHLRSYVLRPSLLEKTKKIFLVDHHRKGADYIKNAVLTFHEPYASSTCELIVEMLGYLDDKVKLRKCEADCIYSGILLDTQNFSVRTGMRTFEAASFLRKVGMDPALAKEYIKESLEDYLKVSDIIRSCEIYKNKAAIAKYYGDEDNNVFIAQAADTLVDIKGISAAFVVFKNKNNILISARSNGTVNVQVIMEKLGGGGHQLIAGAQLTEGTVDKTIVTIKELLDELEEL